jgi:hypothetical protein
MRPARRDVCLFVFRQSGRHVVDHQAAVDELHLGQVHHRCEGTQVLRSDNLFHKIFL